MTAGAAGFELSPLGASLCVPTTLAFELDDEARGSAVVRGAVERYASYVFPHGATDASCEGLATLEGVRVAVAQFCLANHVDFDRIETKFSTIQDNLDGANRDSVDADRLLGWNPDVPLANLAGSRATA